MFSHKKNSFRWQSHMQYSKECSLSCKHEITVHNHWLSWQNASVDIIVCVFEIQVLALEPLCTTERFSVGTIVSCM